MTRCKFRRVSDTVNSDVVLGRDAFLLKELLDGLSMITIELDHTLSFNFHDRAIATEPLERGGGGGVRGEYVSKLSTFFQYFMILIRSNSVGMPSMVVKHLRPRRCSTRTST